MIQCDKTEMQQEHSKCSICVGDNGDHVNGNDNIMSTNLY